MNLNSTLQSLSPELVLSLAETFIGQKEWDKARISLLTFLDGMHSNWSPLSIGKDGKSSYAVWNKNEKDALCKSVQQRVQTEQVQVNYVSYSKAMYLMGQIAIEEGKLDEATTWNTRALELESDHPVLWIQKGQINKLSRRFPSAFKAYKHALNARPWQDNTTKAQAARGAGIVLAELNQPQAAIDMLQESLKLDPGNEHTMNELSGLYLERSADIPAKSPKKSFWKRFR